MNADNPDIRLTLTIGTTNYLLTPLCDDSGFRPYGWRLHKCNDPEATTYDVARTTTGRVACECGDYVFRVSKSRGTCKHGSALVCLGLLDEPAHEPECRCERCMAEARNIVECGF